MQQQKIAYWSVMILVVIFFQLSYGLDIIVPTNIRWLMEAHHDWGTHYLGWAFFRDAPWTFPLGYMPNYCYPAGTNVGLTDSIVLPALLLKPFSTILPEDFQYLGLWLLLCHLMTAHYVIKILRLYNAKALYVILGAVMIAINPILFFRGIHPSLCVHGFILASLYYYLKPSTAATSHSINKAQVWLTLIVSLISPYIWLMIVGFNIILPLKHWYYEKQVNLKKALIHPAIAIGGSILLWIMVGIISFGTSGLEVHNSYGQYSFNLNSFYNSSGFSAFIPLVPWLRPEHQYEGFLYLGVGLMALSVIVIALLIFSGKVRIIRAHKYLLPLILLTILISLFAITNEVSFGTKVLFKYPLPGFVEKIGSIFRASGRFMWVAYYLFFVFILVAFLKTRIPYWAKASVLAVVLFLQAYELKPLYTFRQLNYGSYDSLLDEQKWNEVICHYDRIITYPPFVFTLVNNMDYQDLCFLAVKNKKAITMGYSARVDVGKYERYTDSLTTVLSNGQFSRNELYVTTAQNLDIFGRSIRKKSMQLDFIDGYYLLYPKKDMRRPRRDAAIEKMLDSVRTVYANYSGTEFVQVIDKPVFSPDKIRYNIEEMQVSNSYVKFSGWAFNWEKYNNKGDSLFVTLTGGGKTRIARATQIPRPDITQGFQRENLESSGFSASIFTPGIETRNYDIGIAVKDQNGSWTFINLGTAKELKGRKTFGNYQ